MTGKFGGCEHPFTILPAEAFNLPVTAIGLAHGAFSKLVLMQLACTLVKHPAKQVGCCGGQSLMCRHIMQALTAWAMHVITKQAGIQVQQCSGRVPDSRSCLHRCGFMSQSGHWYFNFVLHVEHLAWRQRSPYTCFKPCPMHSVAESVACPGIFLMHRSTSMAISHC